MSSIQIILITANKERKETMLRQFKELDLYFFCQIHILDASTPDNSQDYLPKDQTDYRKIRQLCCSKSHIRAIEFASLESSADYSIIMEDDAAIDQANFVKGVTEIVERWDVLIPKNCHMVSIGWTPFKHFKELSDMPSKRTIECIPNTKILEWFGNGTMSYIIKKTSAKQFTPLLNHSTFHQLYETITNLNGTFIPKRNTIYACDLWLNRLLVQTLVFPMLVLEQKNNTSTIEPCGGAWHTDIWNNHFKGYETEIKRYWSY